MKKYLLNLIVSLSLSVAVWALPPADEGTYILSPAVFTNGESGLSMSLDFTAGPTAYPASGGRISVFFPLGFNPPDASNFYILPSQSGFLLNGTASYDFSSAQGVTIQVKSLPAFGNLEFLYGFNSAGFSLGSLSATAQLFVYTDPENITTTPVAMGVAVQPTMDIQSPTSTVTSTVTVTPTISPTFTVSPTFTHTATVTPTFTETPLGPLQNDAVYTYPNPLDLSKRNFCTFRFPPGLAGPVEIQVYNMLAEPVRILDTVSINLLEGWATWDGRDDGQRLATGGIYLVRVKGSSKTFTNKFVVYR